MLPAVDRRVVVIGAGITGLTAAYRLVTAEPALDVVVLDADERVGGKIRSVAVGETRVEAGPDSLLARKPWAVDLCREVGLGDQLIGPAVADARLWDGHQLLPFPRGTLGIPTDPTRFLLWPGMTLGARVRALADLIAPRGRIADDESVGELLARRIGRGATDALVAPLLGGVVGGDVDRLSAEATFPELSRWELEHGSLIRGARAASRRATTVGGPAFVTLRGGLQRLPEVLAEAIGAGRIHTATRVREVVRANRRYLVRHEAGEEPADAVIATAPSAALADVLAPVADGVREPLTELSAASTAVVALVYGEGTAEILPRTSGFVARGGSLPIPAATIVSAKWPDPSFGSRSVVRCFVGDDAELRRDDDEIVHDAGAALAHVYGLPLEPDAAHVVRWPHAMPQYEVGHLARVAAIDDALPPGIVAAGQGFRGVGISDCVRQANEAASRVVAHLRDGVPTS
jgi:protoporphyrinogen/coproporphyrinogen III oxidase